MLELQGLCKHWLPPNAPRHTVPRTLWEGLNLTVAAGETVALLGTVWQRQEHFAQGGVGAGNGGRRTGVGGRPGPGGGAAGAARVCADVSGLCAVSHT